MTIKAQTYSTLYDCFNSILHKKFQWADYNEIYNILGKEFDKSSDCAYRAKIIVDNTMHKVWGDFSGVRWLDAGPIDIYNSDGYKVAVEHAGLIITTKKATING
jgi:hypothetical protein